MLSVLDLFSGIGGFSLGLERSGGFKTVAFCEIDPFCRRVLKKHWPDVPTAHDIKDLRVSSACGLLFDGGEVEIDARSIDVICGGFPCQDISVAGKGAGLAGERSGLFYELARLVGELRPRIVILENVSGLLSRGLGDVLGELATLGYDAEWHCIPASAVGAPHRRDRIWIVAHAQSSERRSDASSCRRVERKQRVSQGKESSGGSEQRCKNVPDTIRNELRQQSRRGSWQDRDSSSLSGEHGSSQSLANTYPGNEHGRGSALQVGRQWITRQAIQDGHAGRTQWAAESDVGRVAHGVPRRVDRLGGLGNAVVPQIPELIGHAILASLETKERAA